MTLESQGVRVDTSEHGAEVSIGQRSIALTPDQWRWLTLVAGPSVEIALAGVADEG